MEHEMVLVEWVDTKMEKQTEWQLEEKLIPLDVTPICTTGFVIEETETYITLTQHIIGVHVLGRITIPKEAIKAKCFLQIKEIL